MKYTLLLYTLILCVVSTSCKKEITLISAVKETVLPGLPTQQPHIRYVLEFEVSDETPNLKIERIHFPLLGIEDTELVYDIMHMKSNMIISEITEKGKYLINIIPNNQAQNIVKSKKADEIEIFWTSNGTSRNTKISSFVEKTKRIR